MSKFQQISKAKKITAENLKYLSYLLFKASSSRISFNAKPITH